MEWLESFEVELSAGEGTDLGDVVIPGSIAFQLVPFLRAKATAELQVRIEKGGALDILLDPAAPPGVAGEDGWRAAVKSPSSPENLRVWGDVQRQMEETGSVQLSLPRGGKYTVEVMRLIDGEVVPGTLRVYEIEAIPEGHAKLPLED